MIDKFTAIIKNSDSTVCDLQVIPQEQKILAVSPTSLSLIDISVPNSTNTLSIFSITDKIQIDHGVFVSAACLSIKEFTILTSKGRIARFCIDKSNQIVFNSVSIPRNSYYTCLAQYLHKYYLAGDEKGHFIIFSPDLSIIYINGILENPIKNISTSNSYGMIFLADGTLYSFKISNPAVEKGEFKLELWPELEFVEITPSKVCSSNKFNTNAVYDPKGVLYIISKKDDMTNHTQKIYNLHGLLTMTFSDDENLLILVFKEKIGIWNSIYKRIFYFYSSEIQICNCIAVSHKFLILSLIDKGVAIYPLIHFSKSTIPLMFSPTKIYEFIPTNDGILSNEHEITISVKNNDSSLIEFASADKYGKYIAITTKHRIFIYNRISQQMKLLFDKITLIRDIEWFTKKLCVISFEAAEASFYLFVFKTKKETSDFKLKHKIKLPERPFRIRSNNDDLLIISLYQDILIYDKKMNESKIKVPFHLDEIYPHTNFIFALVTQKIGQKILISITYDGKILPIKENVDSFFVCHDFDLLFALSGTEIFVTSTSHINFTTFISTDSIPIGVTVPNSICAFITAKNNYSKIEPCLSYFYDYAISMNGHFSSEKKDNALNALNSNSIENKKSIILQSSVFLLRQKKGCECFSFVSNFKDVFNEVMVNAMRCVESNERQDMYNLIGSPSKFFMKLTRSKIVKFGCETVKFVDEVNEIDDDNDDFRLSSHLLPIVLEDEGLSIAFPAAFYLIEKIHRFRKDKSTKMKQIKSKTRNNENNDQQNSTENKNENKDSETNNAENKNENKDSETNNAENKNENKDNEINNVNEISVENNDCKNSTNDEVTCFDDSFDDFEYTQNEIDTLTSLFRFIDPILGHVSSIDPEHVSILGMEMSNSIYTELKQQYEDVVTTKLKRLMKFYRPIQMFRFSVMARYSAYYFLSENRQEYEKESIDEIVKHLRETTFCKNHENDEDGQNSFISDMKNTVDLFRRVGLRQWETAVLIAAGKFDVVKKAAEKDDDLISILKKSEWHDRFGF